MPRKPKRREPADPVQSAMSIFAITMATDEEYAAGLPFKNPKAVLAGEKTRPAKKSKKR